MTKKEIIETIERKIAVNRLMQKYMREDEKDEEKAKYYDLKAYTLEMLLLEIKEVTK